MPLTPAQQATIDQLRGTSIVASRPSLDAPWNTQVDWNRSVDRRVADFERLNASRASHQRLVNIGRLASIAPFAVAGGAALAAGGAASGGGASAAGASGWAMPGVTAPTFGAPAAGAATSAAGIGATSATGLSRLSSIVNSPGMELGVNAGLSLIGLRSQNKANAQARADALAARDQEIKFRLQEIAEAKENNLLDRAEAKRLNDEAHALQVEQLNLQKQDQQYRRDLDARDEARLAPYRATSEAAMRRLASIWGIG